MSHQLRQMLFIQCSRETQKKKAIILKQFPNCTFFYYSFFLLIPHSFRCPPLFAYLMAKLWDIKVDFAHGCLHRRKAKLLDNNRLVWPCQVNSYRSKKPKSRRFKMQERLTSEEERVKSFEDALCHFLLLASSFVESFNGFLRLRGNVA